MITEDYISFETAKLLKEKGFDWEESPFYSEQDKDEWRQNNCYEIANSSYDTSIPFDSPTMVAVAPHVSLQMAMKWLREVYEIDIIIFRHIRGKRTTFFDRIEQRTHLEHQSKCNLYLSYEQACEAAIKYCLENLI